MKFMQFLFVIIILAVVTLGVYYLVNNKKSDLDDPLNPVQIAKRKQNLDKILALAAQRVQISNNDVQKNLNLPEATATRYLEYLVNLGKLSRINDRGQQGSYQLIK